MQFLQIDKSTTLSSLSDRVGSRNVDSVLNINSLNRTVNVGKAFYERNETSYNPANETSNEVKISILNQFVGNSDIYERAALGDDVDWHCLASYGCFKDALKLPEDVVIPGSTDVLGNDESVSEDIYAECLTTLRNGGNIDPTVFNGDLSLGAGQYGIIVDAQNIYNTSNKSTTTFANNLISPYQSFKIPWGEILLYTSIDDEFIEIPAFPEDLSDGTSASLSEMPDMIYQYEPWSVYQSSGPREIQFSFHLHRDMWSGDCTDGLANRMIRAIQSNCYPDYDGASVNFPTVAMYISGECLIHGVMTSFDIDWTGPIGKDGFYLEFTMSFNIREVSQIRLNYRNVKNKGLIG